MSATNGFDGIAPFYDSLKRLVFGNALAESQRALLASIKKNGNVLIIGGGTGEVLEALLKVNEGCSVWYVEASSVMIDRTKKRIGESTSSVNFIYGSEDSIPVGVAFDAAITGFFLDLFPEEKVGILTRKIGRHLRNDGLWLITDFVDRGKWWQRLLLWSMYRFFVLSCGIEAHRLPAWEHQVGRNGFRERQATLYFADFIKTSAWEKFGGENVSLTW